MAAEEDTWEGGEITVQEDHLRQWDPLKGKSRLQITKYRMTPFLEEVRVCVRARVCPKPETNSDFLSLGAYERFVLNFCLPSFPKQTCAVLQQQEKQVI